MPSPLGHAFGGLAAGWLVDRQPNGLPSRGRTLLFAAAGMAADLDLLIGNHRGATHSLTAACLAGLLAYIVARHARLAAAVALAWATHPLLDWLGHDTSPPIGVMALWPFTRSHYESGLHVFSAISRRYWLPEFWIGNLIALARELVILGPVLGGVTLVKRAAHGRATSGRAARR